MEHVLGVQKEKLLLMENALKQSILNQLMKNKPQPHQLNVKIINIMMNKQNHVSHVQKIWFMIRRQKHAFAQKTYPISMEKNV